MVRKVHVAGYEAFTAAVEETVKATTEPVQLNVYFTGSKDANGVSWCPDCVVAEPHVYKALEEYAAKDSVMMVVDVGERAFWKDMKNPFRKDSNTQLSVIPTLIRWKSPARLEGDQLTKKSLLEMFFTEDDQ